MRRTGLVRPAAGTLFYTTPWCGSVSVLNLADRGESPRFRPVNPLSGKNSFVLKPFLRLIYNSRRNTLSINPAADVLIYAVRPGKALNI
jgi:hypothetical protein